MILALKTAGPTTEFWVLPAPPQATTLPQPIATLSWESGRQLADQLLGRLTTFLADHHTKLADLTGIAIFAGPGSFTSLRIGHATATALADSLGLPIVNATGDDWLATTYRRLASGHTAPGRPVLPHYGAEAHITKPTA